MPDKKTALISKTYKIRGIRPLLMANDRAADPLSPFFSQLKTLRKTKTKNDDLYRAIDEAMWTSQLYWSEDLKLFIPGDNILQMIISTAAAFRLKKQAKAGLVVDADGFSIECAAAPNTVEEMQKDPNFRLRIMVPNKTGSRSPIVYPKIPTPWFLTFSLTIDPGEIEVKEINLILEKAGRIVGLGGWRPVFGRFEVMTAE